ncbi:MAG: hypothetical protein VW270_18985, partial [Candidatus Poseidoniales archaeon]
SVLQSCKTMNLSLQEVDALITSLELLSNYSERQQEAISPGTDYSDLYRRLKDYRHQLTV